LQRILRGRSRPVREQRPRIEFKIEIGGGLGQLAGKVWRIGLMGYTSRAEHVARLLKALKEVLK